MEQNKNINEGNVNTNGGDFRIGDTYIGKSIVRWSGFAGHFKCRESPTAAKPLAWSGA